MWLSSIRELDRFSGSILHRFEAEHDTKSGAQSVSGLLMSPLRKHMARDHAGLWGSLMFDERKDTR